MTSLFGDDAEWTAFLATHADEVGVGPPNGAAPERRPQPRTATDQGAELRHARDVFRHWLGESYDMRALDVTLAVAACERLGGDPPWLLLISGSGSAKTETAGALIGAGAHVTSTITSEGALLSATARKERSKDATGGLLRKIGNRGVLVLKDFTSILSMSRDARAAVLAALREIYDGRWERNVGVDGGRTLTWTGRIVVVGAVTTAYDSAHTVIAAMGDRFALLRLDSNEPDTRRAAGRQALLNVDHEIKMRAELADAVGAVLARVDQSQAALGGGEQLQLLDVADLVTLARTAVERDYQGNVVDVHAAEMPTRFGKMLGQIVRGGRAIGMTAEEALAAAIRVAGDSMPPLRLSVLADIANHPASRTADVRKRLQKPHNTIDRELQALHILSLLHQGEAPGSGWVYSLSTRVNRDVVFALISR